MEQTNTKNLIVSFTNHETFILKFYANIEFNSLKIS